MKGKKNSNSNIKLMKNLNQEKFKAFNDINLNNFKTLHKKPSKNSKAFYINNQNHIESINIINNNINYKNIILQNLPTSNRQYIGKDSSRNKKNIKLEKNLLFDYNINNNFQTIINKKQKSLNKNSTLKLVLNPSEKENYNFTLNDNEMKYKIKLYEKNNIINKLKDELEYYKSYYHSINQNNSKNIMMPNHNTINVADEIHYNNNINRLNFGLEDKNKIMKTEDLRNKIKNIFSSRKNDIKFFGKNNINKLKLNIENEGEILNDSKINKESGNTIQNNSENKKRNKFFLSNDTFKLNKNSENIIIPTNNVFNRSNSNTLKRKLKIGLHLSELNLDNDNFNSIEADRNHISYNKNTKNNIHSLNKNLILKSINEKEKENDIIKFNYMIKFEDLKRRMNNLVTNLFDLIEKKIKQ